MKFDRNVLLTLSMAILVLAGTATAASATQWYFWVKNDTNSAIKHLLVSQDGKKWGYFKLGSGIAPGSKTKIVWDESTNSQGCTQWLKAKFSDGDESEPSQINFCQDLDEPIVFEK